MRFWDTSAIVPALLIERRTPSVSRLLDADAGMTVWWATEVECASAVARAERRGIIDADGAQAAFERLDELAESWHEVSPSERARGVARRLVRVHDIRAPDALQLAAAIDASEASPSGLSFVTLDLRLADAARREGFSVIVPGAATP